MAKKDRRFVKVYSEGVFGVTELIVDRETGVTYLCRSIGEAGGITPLIDKDGKPVITELDEPEEQA